MSLVDAKNYLYRYPWAATEVDDPKSIIEGLVKDLQYHAAQHEIMRVRACVSEKKVGLLLTVLTDLVHNKSKLTHKRLRDIHRELAKLT